MFRTISIGLRSTRSLLIHQSKLKKSTISCQNIVDYCPYEEIKASIDVQSSESNPIKVNAYGDERMIACACDDIHIMTLKKGPPVKSPCGYWFQLIDEKKFWA